MSNFTGRLIRALYDYDAQSESEVSFRVGETFLVLDDSEPEWYSAINIKRQEMRGFVPKVYFEPANEEPRRHLQTRSDHNAETVCYGTVMYDFTAEREDELTASAKDRVKILAQTDEWYLARKCNGRNGEGLIPKSYVTLDIPVGKHAGNLRIPSVHEWKHKNSSSTSSMNANAFSPSAQEILERRKENMTKSMGALKLGEKKPLHQQDRFAHVIVKASVSTFQKKGDSFVFLVDLKRSHNFDHTLYRSYDDFFNLQKKLIAQFPNEAGKSGGSERILPYLPALTTELKPEMVPKLRADLDEYISGIVQLPHYISKCSLVLQFFLPRGSDPKIHGLKPEKSIDGGELVKKYARAKSEIRSKSEHKKFTPPPLVITEEPSERYNKSSNSLSRIAQQESNDLALFSAPAVSNNPKNSWSVESQVSYASGRKMSIASSSSKRYEGKQNATLHIKIVEPENTSYITVTRDITFRGLKEIIADCVGAAIRSILVERPGRSSLKPITNDAELRYLLERTTENSLIVHI